MKFESKLLWESIDKIFFDYLYTFDFNSIIQPKIKSHVYETLLKMLEELKVKRHVD